MEKSCFNCAYCSETYPGFVDKCDIDDHVIKNPEKESCIHFIESEDIYDETIPE